MNSYLITYDLTQPFRDYDALYEKLESFQDYNRILESVWIVKSSSLAVEIRDELKKIVDDDDKVFVARLSKYAAWHKLGDDVSIWLKENL